MAWTAPQYSRGGIDAAGRELIGPWQESVEPTGPLGSHIIYNFPFDALNAINNWRASHNLPLSVMYKTLALRAKRISSDSITAKRIKRLSSIEAKLRLNPSMQLSRMHDIGGCRAILPTVQEAEALADLYKSDQRSWSELSRPYDYIQAPKDDGYRSIHLVYKYQSRSPDYAKWNGHRIEIQIRSQLQHAWATSVETVSIFTSNSVRSRESDPRWRQLFCLMSSVIALKEDRPIVPGTTPPPALFSELALLADDLKVQYLLGSWMLEVFDAPTNGDVKNASQMLLMIDPKSNLGSIGLYDSNSGKRAFDDYIELESKYANEPWVQVVLVSVDDIKNLRAAYPNYFADTRAFLVILAEAIRAAR